MGLLTLLVNGVADSAGCAVCCCRRQPAAAGVVRAVSGCHRQTAACSRWNSHNPLNHKHGGHSSMAVLSRLLQDEKTLCWQGEVAREQIQGDTSTC